MTRRLLLGALVLALVVPTVAAQTTSQEEVILQFEISKNGSLIGKPALRMKMGANGTVTVNNGPTFTVEPIRHDDAIEIICEFQVADGAKPTLRMKVGQEPSSAKVPVGKDTFEIKVSARSAK